MTAGFLFYVYNMHNQSAPKNSNRPGQIVAIAIACVLIGVLVYMFIKRSASPANDAPTDKIQVVASFYPLADFAKNVGGGLMNVTNITPAGAEPHEYEPTPRDIVKVNSARLLIYNGNGVDPWAEKIESDLKAKGVQVIKMSSTLDSLKKDANDDKSGESDPHFWLDPVHAQKEVDSIADALIQIDKTREKEYNQNRDTFKKQLADLDTEYRNDLANCELRTIVTSHNAFKYLAQRYNLETFYILGLSPEEEPSAKTIAEVSNLAKEKDIKYIFFETLVNPKLSETIANEIGAKTLVLNPIEGLTDEELAAGKNYLSVMRENLNNLRTALQCQ